MGRTIYCDPLLEEKLIEICSKGPGTGLVVGSLVDDRYYGVFLAETPQDEEGESVEKTVTKTLDVGWMVEHAKQVIRLLPGGLTVLGFYIFDSEDIFEKQDGKIRKLISTVGNLDDEVPEEQIVIVNTKTAKVLDTKASAFKSIDMKMAGKPVEFVRVDTSVVLDIPIALASDEKDLSKDVAPGVEKFAEVLKQCIFVFDNQMLGDKHVIGKSVEADKKKGKGKNKSDAQDNSDLEDCSAQEVLNVEILFTDSPCPAEVVPQSSMVRLKFAGKLSSRSYLAPGATVQMAKKAVKSDLLRSLKTRLAMHCDTMQEAEEDEEVKVVHEPPRRVFVSVGDVMVQGIAVCDYLYPGECLEDCVNNMKEIFGWDVIEDSIEDDVEIVASPRETRPPASPSASEKEKQARRSRFPFAVVASCGMALVSAGIAYMSLSD
eukprot:GFUD01032466.1.p1 GENE.GFUD01032466.1~~GFUD01032466.1.p1  ORF type:complete len:432 (+),score=114.88 GFUD01032466.1:37-1332(+)